jgi:hypothetical protein
MPEVCIENKMDVVGGRSTFFRRVPRLRSRHVEPRTNAHRHVCSLLSGHRPIYARILIDGIPLQLICEALVHPQWCTWFACISDPPLVCEWVGK